MISHWLQVVWQNRLPTLLRSAPVRTRRLIVLDTNPLGATVYLNDTRIGETPVQFTFDMNWPVTLVIEKEGYKTRAESINVGWVKSEYHQGHYTKKEYEAQGETRKTFEVRTLRDLIKLESK